MTANWKPNLDDAAERMQPGYSCIWSEMTRRQKYTDRYFPRPQHHLDQLTSPLDTRKNTTRTNSKRATNCGEKHEVIDHDNHVEINNDKLQVIRNIQRIAHTKELEEQATLKDWDTRSTVAQETTAMIRNCGFANEGDARLDEKKTLPTLPIPSGIQIIESRGRKKPVIFDDDFFEMKPADEFEEKDLKRFDISGIDVKTLKDQNRKLSVLSAPLNNQNKNSITDARDGNKTYDVIIDDLDNLTMSLPSSLDLSCSSSTSSKSKDKTELNPNATAYVPYFSDEVYRSVREATHEWPAVSNKKKSIKNPGKSGIEESSKQQKHIKQVEMFTKHGPITVEFSESDTDDPTIITQRTDITHNGSSGKSTLSYAQMINCSSNNSDAVDTVSNKAKKGKKKMPTKKVDAAKGFIYVPRHEQYTPKQLYFMKRTQD